MQTEERKRIKRLEKTMRDAKDLGDVRLTTAVQSSLTKTGKGKTSDPSTTHRDQLAKLSNGAVRLERIYHKDREHLQASITNLEAVFVQQRTQLEQTLTALQNRFDEDVATAENIYTQQKLEHALAVETAKGQMETLEHTYHEKTSDDTKQHDRTSQPN